MGIDEQYKQHLFNSAYKNLSNWADVIIRQIEAVGSVSLGNLEKFKETMAQCDKLYFDNTYNEIGGVPKKES